MKYFGVGISNPSNIYRERLGERIQTKHNKKDIPLLLSPFSTTRIYIFLSSLFSFLLTKQSLNDYKTINFINIMITINLSLKSME